MEENNLEFVEKSSTSTEEENSIIDEDICTEEEINAQFSHKYLIASEETSSSKDVYALSLACNKRFDKIATGLSNGTVQFFDITTQMRLERLYPITTPSTKTSSICGLKFLDDNSFFIGKNNGQIFMYDLRTNKKVATFEDNSEEKTKPILCFDVNCNERILCAGTEQILQDSFLLFFDIRHTKMLGGYWESHQDDITIVNFHPQNSDLLISGSTDGLINMFDIKQTSEDDAIQMTFNTEKSVHRINWHKNVYDKDVVSCITHTNDLQFFLADEGDLISNFSCKEITSAIKRKYEGDSNIINCHNMGHDSFFVLAGSNYNNGSILRSVKVFNKNLLPYATYDDNKQIVRDSLYDVKSGNLVTSGENGIVTLWTEHLHEKLESTSSKLKMKTIDKVKPHKHKPY